MLALTEWISAKEKRGGRTVAVLAVCSLLATAAVIGGCGGANTTQSSVSSGGGSSSTPTRGKGSITFSVKWPEASRLIPAAARSLNITVSANNTTAAQAVITSPGAGKSSTKTIDSLSPGDYLVTITANPNPDGTGVAQATASLPVTVIVDQNVDAHLTLASTINSLRIAPSSATVEITATPTLTAQALNTNGDVVLTAPQNITWQRTTGNSLIVTPQADGTAKITPVSLGSSTLKVTERESGKSLTFTLTVIPQQPAVTDPLVGITQDSSAGYGINESGQVVGKVVQSGVSLPFRTTTAGAIQLLTQKTLDTGGTAAMDGGQANGINKFGHVVGTMGIGANQRAFLWKAADTVPVNLGYLNSNTANPLNFSVGLAINDNGNITGYSKDWCGCWRSYRTGSLATIVKGSAASGWGDDIGSFLGQTTVIHTFAFAINNNSQVAGIGATARFTSSPSSGDTSEGNTTIDPGTSYLGFAAGGILGTSTPQLRLTGAPACLMAGINDAGDAVGWAGTVVKVPGSWMNEVAVIRRVSNGTVTTLGSLGTGGISRAYDINNKGLVVGFAFNGANKRAFLVENGVMKDLNNELPTGSGWTLIEARAINDKNQITGIGVKDGKTKAFLLDLHR